MAFGLVVSGLAMAPVSALAQSPQDRWRGHMTPAENAHMLGNYGQAEDHYQEALALAEKFDRSGEFLERSMGGLAGLYTTEGRHEKAAGLYRQALSLAEGLYGPENSRYSVIAIYRAALMRAENALTEIAAARAAQAKPAPEPEGPARAVPSMAARSAAMVATAAGPAPETVQEPAPLAPPPVLSPEPGAPVLSGYVLAGAPVETEPEPVVEPIAPHVPEPEAAAQSEQAPSSPEVAARPEDAAPSIPIPAAPPVVVDQYRGELFPNVPRLADREDAYLNQLDDLQRALGPSHPDVALILFKLARMYHRLSRYDRAAEFYQRCLTIREKALAEGDPATIETMTFYARLLRSSGYSERAAELRARADSLRAKGQVAQDR